MCTLTLLKGTYLRLDVNEPHRHTKMTEKVTKLHKTDTDLQLEALVEEARQSPLTNLIAIYCDGNGIRFSMPHNEIDIATAVLGLRMAEHILIGDALSYGEDVVH